MTSTPFSRTIRCETGDTAAVYSGGWLQGSSIELRLCSVTGREARIDLTPAELDRLIHALTLAQIRAEDK